MIRAQIQLPDELYHEAKRLCEKREMSLAELARRGVEHMVTVLNRGRKEAPWLPPQPQSLGWNDLTEEEIKRIAQEGSTEQEASER
jgi:hypothetical protein